VIGPDILCWSTTFFTKEARSPSFVSWHQDATYWGLSTDDVITAWVAFADAPVESGAMKFWPGSHLKKQIEHRDTFDQNNLLTRGQEIAVDVPDGAGSRRRAESRRDVVAPCAAGAQFGTQHHE
jgi:ectoine hydroxylase-related dioxygenase (phytanoyl-CoA dioxygenase family)